MWGRAALIGDTGFVGGALLSQLDFAETYNSRTIDQLTGKHFDILVCAGAPAVMWAANSNPDADRANLERLAGALASASIGHLVLISTIAVLDDAAAGYTESTARYETRMAYGRNRRWLEEQVLEHPSVSILRLPALFGQGLKKNFIFDLLNPIPSFVKPEKFSELRSRAAKGTRGIIEEVYSFDSNFGMHKLDRLALEASGRSIELEKECERLGFIARNFTNSSSQFQFYNLEYLWNDIQFTMRRGGGVLHICPEPWEAAELHKALLGVSYTNDAAAIVREDMRTEHAQLLGRSGFYHYDRSDILRDLKHLFAGKGKA